MEFEGKRQGYDISNLSKLVNKVKVPVICFGGAVGSSCRQGGDEKASQDCGGESDSSLGVSTIV